MSNFKVIPKGQKDKDCKKGSCKKRHLIPYVPVIDLVQDVVNMLKVCPMKIKHPAKTQIVVPIWHSGMPEVFNSHS
jgi:hypothetical protein